MDMKQIHFMQPLISAAELSEALQSVCALISSCTICIQRIVLHIQENIRGSIRFSSIPYENDRRFSVYMTVEKNYI